MKIAVIGTGSMGTNHARVVAASPAATLDIVIDQDLDKARVVAAEYGARASADPDDARHSDAAIVATSTGAHTEIGLHLLAAGRPLLIEKPLSVNLGEVTTLVDEAQRRDLPLMCGFVERFNPVVSAVLGRLDRPIVHVVAMRHSPPNPRATIDVVHDLLIHDIDLTLRFIDETAPARVGAGLWRRDGGLHDVADCVLRFPGGGVATLSSSRASQRKLRLLHVDTGTALYELDLLRATVTVYQHVSHEIVGGVGGGYRASTIVDVPFVRHLGEPLALQLRHFLELASSRGDAAAERAGILPPHRIAAAVVAQA